MRLKTLELLAPAGNLEAFWAAAEKKADAVYIGWSNFNARVQAENFSLSDISRIIPFAHNQGIKVYIALNILLKEKEFPKIIEGLSILKELSPDALIIQDMGLYYLIKHYFPDFRLHGSTLMNIHNHLGADYWYHLGFKRVVLARELSLREINAIAKRSSLELEVFVHGALCYSFSGLCLMSSYLGGKSSLRGRCVQPCRRLYKSGKKSGSFFSLNDLSAIRLLPQLKRAGVTSIKLEGRMRSAHYVSSVVEAYRIVLDAPEGDAEALKKAEGLISQCLGRKPTSGYFLYPQVTEVITPHQFGTAGLFLGKIMAVRDNAAVVKLAAEARIGDRLRLVRRVNNESSSFSLGQIRVQGKSLNNASGGQEVMIKVPTKFNAGDLLFKVDVKTSQLLRGSDRIRTLLFSATKNHPKITKKLKPPITISSLFQAGRPTKQPQKLKWWVKLGYLKPLLKIPRLGIHRLLIPLDAKNLAQYRRYHKRFSHIRKTIAWMLPPVIEEKQIPFYRQMINELCREGFKYWHLGHISQQGLFAHRKIHFSLNYTANALNSLSCRLLYDLGIEEIEFSIETDRENLKAALTHFDKCSVGLTVYGHPPLFTSRLFPPGLNPGANLRSPRGESFTIDDCQQLTLVRSLRPYSIRAHEQDLKKLGLSFLVIDFTGTRPTLEMLSNIMEGKGNRKTTSKIDTFNFSRKLA